MDEFLKIIYRKYANENGVIDAYQTYFEELVKGFDKTVSNDISKEFQDILMNCALNNNEFYFVEGMKLAIKIMEKKYIPRV